MKFDTDWASVCLKVPYLKLYFKIVTNTRWYHKGLSLNIGKACACVIMCVFFQPNKNLNNGQVNVNCFGRSFTFENNFMKALNSYWCGLAMSRLSADVSFTCSSSVKSSFVPSASRTEADSAGLSVKALIGWRVGWNVLLLSHSTFISQPAERKLIYLQCHSFFYSFIFFGSVHAHTACESL